MKNAKKPNSSDKKDSWWWLLCLVSKNYNMVVDYEMYSVYFHVKYTDLAKEQLTLLCYGMTKGNKRFGNIMHSW
jgi:uncharacterized membrane protein YhaH (DUF805 family)